MDNHSHQQLLTKEGLNALKAEHEELVKVKRPATVIRLSDAREAGDLSENSEYVAAKQDLAFIDGRIAELEEIIRAAKIISSKATGQIDIGSKVILHVNGKKEEYLLVGEWEADPMQKKISHESPLGKALLGKKVGEMVEVEAPAGKIKYKVLEIG
ncbi:MAG: Transcription elongation factor GreA [Candidatus Gottesmanbacteria bacterium GW2011_GWA2_44_17]|uniref:Transcription elongation factor GreA n=2 Tax=Candidatus Gottesmaniibacteriota TaxID=1752720 RepID=A0A0G1HL06_9BACT|nr:MAG: Transcription elongation factor GreA [Microgenomates group bacterium GW2011_GWC1_43_11]KKT37383.1 MAG: Transcription elongation factor GreA [Candidatus Gottesmanbacteria bacterium GW2011_GWB1_44_11c]KKT47273.1 MAG: Transcription elongation factor GreA [Candidatus Gottesmanbacteria bacterium GW2011_GWA2_44_17]HCM82752.1 transcription elongation factor GreA [Patescibacteria group bacterium]